jgi:hypothetical protein
MSKINGEMFKRYGIVASDDIVIIDDSVRDICVCVWACVCVLYHECV